MSNQHHHLAQKKPYNMFKKHKVIVEVVKDLNQRSERGKETYGTYLYPYNGRNAIMDAYQEALDLSMYLKQFMLEKEIKSEIVKVFTLVAGFIVVVSIFFRISNNRKKNCA